MGLDEQVELGAVTDVDEWYRGSIFPSLWKVSRMRWLKFQQGLPTVGLEQTAGVNELLRHNDAGFLPLQMIVFCLRYADLD